MWAGGAEAEGIIKQIEMTTVTLPSDEQILCLDGLPVDENSVQVRVLAPQTVESISFLWIHSLKQHVRGSLGKLQSSYAICRPLEHL